VYRVTCLIQHFLAVCAALLLAPPGAGNGVILRPDAGAALEHAMRFLRQRGNAVERAEGGNLLLRPTERLADALRDYQEILQTRIHVAETNIENADTLADVNGENRPHRRHYVSVDPRGRMEIKQDNSPLPRFYRPAHPCADGAGYVLRTNVDEPVESAIISFAAMERALVRTLELRVRAALRKP
jgi:hypothetical protein